MTTRTGLTVTATCFEQTYLTGLNVSKAEFKNIQLTRHDICPPMELHHPATPEKHGIVFGRVLRRASDERMIVVWAAGNSEILLDGLLCDYAPKSDSVAGFLSWH